MSKLPVCSGREVCRVLTRAGWVVDRQRGSHNVMVKPIAGLSVVVPDHLELAPGTLRGIIHDAGLTVLDFCRLLH